MGSTQCGFRRALPGRLEKSSAAGANGGPPARLNKASIRNETARAAGAGRLSFSGGETFNSDQTAAFSTVVHSLLIASHSIPTT